MALGHRFAIGSTSETADLAQPLGGVLGGTAVESDVTAAGVSTVAFVSGLVLAGSFAAAGVGAFAAAGEQIATTSVTMAGAATVDLVSSAAARSVLTAAGQGGVAFETENAGPFPADLEAAGIGAFDALGQVTAQAAFQATGVATVDWSPAGVVVAGDLAASGAAIVAFVSELGSDVDELVRIVFLVPLVRATFVVPAVPVPTPSQEVP